MIDYIWIRLLHQARLLVVFSNTIKNRLLHFQAMIKLIIYRKEHLLDRKNQDELMGSAE